MLARMLTTVLINLSYTVFNVTGNKAAQERVYICRQPDLEWSKAFLSLLLYRKAKDCPSVLWSDKKIHYCQLWAPSNVLKNHWFLPDTAAWDGASKHGRQSPTILQWERENHWLIAIMWHLSSPTTCIARHCSFIKLKLIRNVCLSCGTLAEQVNPHQRFYCNVKFIFKKIFS